MYDNDSTFRQRSKLRKLDHKLDFNKVEVDTIMSRGYIINALMERDTASLSRLGSLSSDDIDYIMSISECFLAIIYDKNLLPIDLMSSSQLLKVAKKYINLGVETVFFNLANLMNIDDKKALVQHCIMINPNALSYYSFDRELLPIHNPPLAMIKNADIDHDSLLKLWLNSEYWSG
jgi:hypothetical protein